jgi:type VI secretion system protein ImpE
MGRTTGISLVLLLSWATVGCTARSGPPPEASPADYSEVNAVIQAGEIVRAVSMLEARIQENPGNSEDHFLLFELLAMLERWDEAEQHVQTAARLEDDDEVLLSFLQPIQAEQSRARCQLEGECEVGLVEAEAEWAQHYLSAVMYRSGGDRAEALDLLAQGQAGAQSCGGRIGDERFVSIHDSDDLQGPFMELLVGPVYVWIPFCSMVNFEVGSFGMGLDAVWLPATITLPEGGELTGLTPRRYVGATRLGEQVLMGGTTLTIVDPYVRPIGEHHLEVVFEDGSQAQLHAWDLGRVEIEPAGD